MASLSEWSYGRAPVEALRFADALDGLKLRLASGERVFENLIEKLLLDNPHEVTVQLLPDIDLSARLKVRSKC